MIRKVKRQPLEGEEIIANETTDRGLISKIHKQLIQLNTRRTNNLIKKVVKRLKHTFFQRRHTHKKMLNIAQIREMRIKPQCDITSHQLE